MTEPSTLDPARSNREQDDAGIGATLRAAREARHMSEIDLARALRLEPRVVRALETEDFAALSAPAFVRGYLRAVARELKLDAEALLARFDALGDHAAPQLADFESRAPLEITSSSRIVRYTTVALALVMLALIVLWWRSHEDRDFSMLKYLAESNPSAIEPLPPTPPLPYRFDQIEHDADPFFRAPEPVVVDATGAAPVDGAPPVAAALPGADIVISTSADAWVEVLDAVGTRLYYNLVRPGNEVRLGGQRPYALVIGNTPAVRLTYDGRPVDLAPLARDGVVKLSLGDAAPAAQESQPDEH